jgi:hypothetical protein
MEFLQLRVAGHRLTLYGSGVTTVTTPPGLDGRRGRMTFTVDLGPADTRQQFTLGAKGPSGRRTVSVR